MSLRISHVVVFLIFLKSISISRTEYCNGSDGMNQSSERQMNANDDSVCVNRTFSASDKIIDVDHNVYTIGLNSATFKVCVALLIIVLHIQNSCKHNSIINTDQNKELLNKFEHLRAILNSVSVGVISTDRKLKITFINFAAGRICGLNPVTATGKQLHEVLPFANVKGNDVKVMRKLDSVEIESANDLTISHNGKRLNIQQKILPLLLQGEEIGVVTLLQDVTSTVQLMKNLSHNASHDALTGLPNRVAFESVFSNAVNTCEEENLRHALVFLDLDGFKAINDNAGHAAGDELLKQIGQLMRSNIRRSDFLARIGGDEFCIILFDCDLKQARILMEDLVSLIINYSFWWGGVERRVGASVGITSVECKRDIDELLSQADSACYIAKRRGKRQVCLYEDA